jgi:hypothetical protein
VVFPLRPDPARPLAPPDARATSAHIEPFETIPAVELPDLHEEGARLLAFMAAGTEARIVVREPIG